MSFKGIYNGVKGPGYSSLGAFSTLENSFPFFSNKQKKKFKRLKDWFQAAFPYSKAGKEEEVGA